MLRKQLVQLIASVICFAVIVNLAAGTLLSLITFTDFDKVYSCNEKFLNDTELELIKIPVGVSYHSAANFQRLNDHEIIYNNKLYDVVKHFIKGDVHYYYCMNDSKEEKILEQIKQCTEAHLDYFNSSNHAASITYKLFTQENFSAGLRERNLPILDFVFISVNNKNFEKVFLNEVNHPPENLFS